MQVSLVTVNAAEPVTVTVSGPVAASPELNRVNSWVAACPVLTRPWLNRAGVKASYGAAGVTATHIGVVWPVTIGCGLVPSGPARLIVPSLVASAQ